MSRHEFERRYEAMPLFPGLWLTVPSLLEGNMAQVLAVLQEGLNSPEHALICEAFVLVAVGKLQLILAETQVTRAFLLSKLLQ